MEDGELKAVEMWRACPWGVEGVLAEKRLKRGWTDERRGELVARLEGAGGLGTGLEWMRDVVRGKRVDVPERLGCGA